MERWRVFFNRSGEDIWTIIEQAIRLAATDYPSQFREKRCNIAEAIFARRPRQSDTDITRLSTVSVVSNYKNQTQAADEARVDHVGTHTRGDVDVKVQVVDSTQPNHPAFSSNAGGSDLLVATAVSNIQKTLNDPIQMDEIILHALRTLESLHISVDVLKATEIGKQVNNLRKHTCRDVRLIARDLVRQWKGLVDEWVINNTENATIDPPAGHTTTSGSMEEGGMISVAFNETMHLTHREFPEERGSTSRAQLSGDQGFLKGKVAQQWENRKLKLGPESSKRKAAEDDPQVVKHANKQHVAQGIISKDLLRGGPVARSKVAAPCLPAQRSYWNEVMLK